MTGPFVPSSGLPKGGFRFALGSEQQPQSLVWRVWTRDDEVHVSVRTVALTTELIAYPTGRWRIEVGGIASRWHRPKEFRPGWTRGPDIVFPGMLAGAKPPVPSKKETEPIHWLRGPGEGQAARVQMWFATPGADETRWRQALSRSIESVAVLALRRAGALHLIRLDEPADPESGDRGTGARGVVVRADQSGRPSFWETVA